MMMPSIFGENLFNDWFDFSFPEPSPTENGLNTSGSYSCFGMPWPWRFFLLHS